MSLPERRETAGQLSTDHAPARTPAPPLPPLEPVRDFGWLITVLGAVGSLLVSWILFSPNESDSMWAGYWISAFATAALLGVALMRTTLPAGPGFTVVAASGIGMVLSGVLHDYNAMITITMAVGGALIALGAVCQTVRHT